MFDIQFQYIHGRPGRAWILSVPYADISSITMQSVEYDDWRDAVQKLVAAREARSKP